MKVQTNPAAFLNNFVWILFFINQVRRYHRVCYFPQHLIFEHKSVILCMKSGNIRKYVTGLYTFFWYFFSFHLFIYLTELALPLSSCGDCGLLSSCAPQASHCSGFPCCGSWTLHRRLSHLAHGVRYQGMWDLPGPGIKPVSPALAGGLPATGPPEKSQTNLSPGLEPGGLFLFSFRNLSPLSWCPIILGPWLQCLNV